MSYYVYNNNTGYTVYWCHVPLYYIQTYHKPIAYTMN